MICRRRKLIFVHIPKCGGTSVQKLIWGQDSSTYSPDDLWGGFVAPHRNQYQTGGLQHLTAQFIRQHVGDDLFKACFKFTIVRDPVARISSQIAYMAQRTDLREFLGLPDEFETDAYLDAIAAREHVQWKPQMDFLLDHDRKTVLVDQIYRLEETSKDPSDLFAATGIRQTVLPATNKSNPAKRPVLNARQLARIEAQFHDDFLFLGYPLPSARAG